MRIHLGHHFYGAGNLGDDFMLAGYLLAMHRIAADATFTASVPFPLAPLVCRFPRVQWIPYDLPRRDAAIAEADAWVGIGGSPFQSAQSRWFIDHLLADAASCRTHRVPMFYLGIGVQTEAEIKLTEVRDLCVQAEAIYTRDTESADRLRRFGNPVTVTAAADLAHLYFSANRPPSATAGRLTLVPNFDYAAWPSARSFLGAISKWPLRERIWLAQESRELPGSEKALFAALTTDERDAWQLVEPERPREPLENILRRWPSGEWLVTARYHAAIAGAWAGSKIVVVATNEKLRGIANEISAPVLEPDATEERVREALITAVAPPVPSEKTDIAFEACGAVVRRIFGN